MPEVADADRAPPDHAVRLEIVGGDRAAAGGDGRGDLRRQLAAVERRRPLGGDERERLVEAVETKHVAGHHPPAVRPAVEPPALGVVAQDQVEDRVQVRL